MVTLICAADSDYCCDRFCGRIVIECMMIHSAPQRGLSATLSRFVTSPYLPMHGFGVSYGWTEAIAAWPNRTRRRFVSSHLTSSHLISPYLISPRLISSRLISSRLVLSCLGLSCLLFTSCLDGVRSGSLPPPKTINNITARKYQQNNKQIRQPSPT